MLSNPKMTEESKQILQIMTNYLDKHPEIRFSQMLFNLGINTFADKADPSKKEFLLRDPYNDNDNTVLQRVLKATAVPNEQV